MKRKGIRVLVFVAALLLQTAMVQAQYIYTGRHTGSDTLRLPKWEPHLAVATGFMGSSAGDNRIFTTVAPSLTYRPSSRWTVNAGFGITSDMGLNPNYAMTRPTRNLAPYKRNGGTGLVSAHAEAIYRAGENVWLAAAVYHLSGSYAPLFGMANGRVLDVSATAISAAAAFRLSEKSFLQLSFTAVHDRYGTMPALYHDAWMHGGCGSWGLYSPLAGYGHMPHLFNPYYFDGLY